jgi:hypothetical protein
MHETIPTETWQPIPWDKRYQVSDQGRVTGIRTPILRPHRDSNGYSRVFIGSVHTGVHQLVLAAFVGPCPDGMEVRHLNGSRSDNRLSNLSYGTVRQNRLDQQIHGTDWELNKTHCPRGHEYSAVNTYRAPGSNKRECRPCKAINMRNYRARKTAA